MTLYEFCVFLDEKRDRDNELIEKAAVVVEPTTILASDEAQAQLLAARAIPDGDIVNIDRLVVVVRPF
jgi:hypothetical protein